MDYEMMRLERRLGGVWEWVGDLCVSGDERGWGFVGVGGMTLVGARV